ncbi:hypothetical protein SAMD00079811_19440 [Scytonema sp. HK-05]|nr:hypothetical protein SAMD00079811_19440 [Scytonema sp. HK-05]
MYLTQSSALDRSKLLIKVISLTLEIRFVICPAAFCNYGSSAIGEV